MSTTPKIDFVKSNVEMMKSMKLSAMAYAYQSQSEAPEKCRLSFDERLYSILRQANASRMTNRQLKLLKESKLTMKMADFANFDWNADRQDLREYVENLSDFEWAKDPTTCRPILITGATGTGKTFLAQCFGKSACMLGLTTSYFKMTEFDTVVEEAVKTSRIASLQRSLIKKSVLILDEFATIPLTELGFKTLFNILDDRHREKATIICSQLTIDKWHAQLKQLGAEVADAMMDRLIHRHYSIVLKGDSLRDIY